jgi:heme O synthase-like polyprenyltransferase
VAWPVLVILVALGAVFVVLTAPLWKEVTSRVARRGFLYSGPYLIFVILAILANSPLLDGGFRAAFG